MPKPPDGAHAEYVRLLDMLEFEYHRMRDVNAQVSRDGLCRVHALREELDRAQSKLPQSPENAGRAALAVVRAVGTGIAREVVRWLIETSICWIAAHAARLQLYDYRRSSPHVARLRGAQAE